MYKNIVLATDGSEHAERAAKHAIQMTKTSPNSKLEIIYVVDHNKVKSDVLSNWNTADLGEGYKDRVKDIELMAKEVGVPYESIILHGDPGPKIVDYVNKNQIDMVVLGSRGLNALQEFVLGSVSHTVAKRAHCPVMIVK